MKSELLIAIVSGLITLGASSWVAVYQARAELKKLTRQLEQTYTTSLFDQRLNAYPILFKTLHDFNNIIEYGTPSKQHLIKFQTQYDTWTASHAILLTPKTAKIIWGYHYYLLELIEQHHDSLLALEQWIEIRNTQVVISKFLRAEIGVFDTMAAGIPESNKPHVKAILDKLDKSSKTIRNRFGY
mgnify:FL=1